MVNVIAPKEHSHSHSHEEPVSLSKQDRPTINEIRQRDPGEDAAEQRQISSLENTVQDEFKEGIEEVEEDFPLAELAGLASLGSVSQISSRLDLSSLSDRLDGVVEGIGSVHTRGMELEAERLRTQYDIEDIIATPDSSRAQAYVRQHGGRMIQQVRRETRQAIRQVVARGINQGLSAQRMAVQMRDAIGLTARQEAAVNNFRRMLINQDSDAVGRFLNATEKAQARRIVNQGGSLDEIDNLTERYRQHQVNLRAQRIASYESRKAMQMSKINQAKDLVDQGVVKKGQIRKVWIAVVDTATCAFCLDLNGTTETLDTEFVGKTELVTTGETRELRGLTPPIHGLCRCEIVIHIIQN